jgi:adenosylcobyric acid synthase
MLARSIDDEVESASGTVAGLGLLPASVRFGHHKVLEHPTGTAYGHSVDTAYAIHHGIVRPDTGSTPFLDGCRTDSTWGTTWHGAFESDGFRRAFLRDVARQADRPGFEVAPDTSFGELRNRRLDVIADAVADHLDMTAIQRLIDDGPPAGQPFVPPGAP